MAVPLVGGCGGGEPSVAEYASSVEELVAEMEADFAALDTEWESNLPTAERAAGYWDGRLEIRDRFLAGITDLTPPDGVASMHESALELFTRITAADRALAASVASYETITDHWQWVDTAEGRAADAILAEVYEFCRASQAEFDETRDREALGDTPWIPAEMKEIVKVAFGCPP